MISFKNIVKCYMAWFHLSNSKATMESLKAGVVPIQFSNNIQDNLVILAIFIELLMLSAACLKEWNKPMNRGRFEKYDFSDAIAGMASISLGIIYGSLIVEFDVYHYLFANYKIIHWEYDLT